MADMCPVCKRHTARKKTSEAARVCAACRRNLNMKLKTLELQLIQKRGKLHSHYATEKNRCKKHIRCKETIYVTTDHGEDAHALFGTCCITHTSKFNQELYKLLQAKV